MGKKCNVIKSFFESDDIGMDLAIVTGAADTCYPGEAHPELVNYFIVLIIVAAVDTPIVRHGSHG